MNLHCCVMGFNNFMGLKSYTFPLSLSLFSSLIFIFTLSSSRIYKEKRERKIIPMEVELTDEHA